MDFQPHFMCFVAFLPVFDPTCFLANSYQKCLSQPAFGEPHESPDLACRGSGAAHAEFWVLVLHTRPKGAMSLASDQWRGGGSAPQPTSAPCRPPPCRLCFAPRSALPPPFVLQVNAVICDPSRDRRKVTRDVANYCITSRELRCSCAGSDTPKAAADALQAALT